MIQDAILRGPLGHCFTIMDATARASLPTGVFYTHIPTWMHPHLPADIVSLMRPDLLIIEGLTQGMVSSNNLRDPAVLHHIQTSCKIHLLELGYTSDASYTTSLSRKHFQHVRLCRELTRAGWTLSLTETTPYHILLLGMTGHVFRPCRETLLSLGISKSATLTLMKKLHLHAVRFAHYIIRLRRRLEWTFDYDALPP